jgi:hypothetical protein|tara:strand:+ start:3001 stop:3213 length:213 start_codon:yes stop_codon:yes gene_type:complete
MVSQRWLNQKLRKLKARKKWLRNMENKDVQVIVTGVSMTGESQLNEHNGITQENKEELEREEIGTSREDD